MKCKNCTVVGLFSEQWRQLIKRKRASGDNELLHVNPTLCLLPRTPITLCNFPPPFPPSLWHSHTTDPSTNPKQALPMHYA